jgi:hypothetical protein
MTYHISRRAWGAYLYGSATRANLDGADLGEANLRWANLSRANLSEANLRWANLSRANLSEANLRWANLSRADLRWANLSRADLRWANLSEANLSRANLSEANLRWANLSRADLRWANLSRADLPNTDRVIHCPWSICHIRADMIRIGCEYHSVAEWAGFSDDAIAAMDKRALEWWRENKEIVLSIAAQLG